MFQRVRTAEGLSDRFPPCRLDCWAAGQGKGGACCAGPRQHRRCPWGAILWRPKPSHLAVGSAVPGRNQQPSAVAVLGITAYRIAFASPEATMGRQPVTLDTAQLWVVPNPSGLNRRTSLADLAASYRQVALAAGLQVWSAVRLPAPSRSPRSLMSSAGSRCA